MINDDQLIHLKYIDDIEIKIEGKYDPYTRDHILHKLDNRFKEYESDIKKLSKYITTQLTVAFVLKIENPKGETKGLTRPEKTPLTRKLQKYNVYVQADDIDKLTHELCHVIDKSGTKEAFSNQKEFEPLLTIYKDTLKKQILHIKENPTLTKEQKKKEIAYWKDTYRNGTVKTEIFARFCDSYLHNKENLDIKTDPSKKDKFDILCDKIYEHHKELFEQYFDTILSYAQNKEEVESTDQDDVELTEEDIYEFKTELSYMTEQNLESNLL